jgi:hypothetical protein
MDRELLLIDYIKSHWQKHQAAQLERGVWIALHQEMAAAADYADTPVVKAWFITDRHIEKCAPLSFKLFAENRLKVKVNESHEMGIANIAPYPQPGHYYLDFMFAPLWGGGMKISIEEEQIVYQGRLWVL